MVSNEGGTYFFFKSIPPQLLYLYMRMSQYVYIYLNGISIDLRNKGKESIEEVFESKV